MAKSYGTKPRTQADKKLSIKHVKMTMKLNKQKASDHLKLARSNAGDTAHNMSHYKSHKKDVKDNQKYLKKLAKVRVKATKK